MRFIIPFLLIFPLLSLSSAVYKSNSIAQILSEESALTKEGYEVELLDNVTTFYQDGVLLKKTTIDGNSKIIEENGSTTVIEYAENGNILSETTSKGNDVTIKRYEYSEDGILNRVIETEGDEVKAIYSYDYSPLTNLSALYYDEDGKSVSYISPSSFSYNHEVPVKVTEYPGLLLREEYSSSSKRSAESNEDGSFTLTEETSSSTTKSKYSSLGLIEKREVFDTSGALLKSEEYEYIDNDLISSSILEGDTLTKSTYTDGSLTSQAIYNKGTLTKEREYRGDKSFYETQYKNGKAYARLLYDSDGMRVLSLEML